MYVIPLGPPSMISRHPDAPVQVGYHDDQVVLALDVTHARRLASLMALIGSTRVSDRTALQVSAEERDEWMHAVVEVLAAAAFVSGGTRRRAYKIFPVRHAYQSLAEMGDRETERTPADSSHRGPLTCLPPAEPTGPVPVLEWNFSIADAGELDDAVLDGFVCACGWTAIDKGPDITPTYADDITAHLDVCRVADSEITTREGALA